MRAILCIGHGDRYGIVTTRIISAIESRLNRRIATAFDIIGGSGSGGLVSAMITTPTWHNVPPTAAATLTKLKKWANGDSWWGRSKRTKKLCEMQFGDTTLSQTWSNLILATYDRLMAKPHAFNGHIARLGEQEDFRIRDISALSLLGRETFKSTGNYTIIGVSTPMDMELVLLVAAQRRFRILQDYIMVTVGPGTPSTLINDKYMTGLVNQYYCLRPKIGKRLSPDEMIAATDQYIADNQESIGQIVSILKDKNT